MPDNVPARVEEASVEPLARRAKGRLLLAALVVALLATSGCLRGCEGGGEAAPGSTRLVGRRADLRRAQIRGEGRFVLAPAPRRFRVTVPAAAVLEFSFGVTRAGWQAGAQAVDFTVSAEADGRTRVLFRDHLTRPALGRPNQWHRAAVPLDALAGQEVVVIFDGREAAGAAVPPEHIVWSNPRIVGTNRASDDLNIVLISIDTLRPDHLGCYGSPRDTSPTIDRMAREGILFRRAISAANWTLPAHASLFTGLVPSRHGAVQFGMGTPLQDELTTLPERLWDAGYRTAGFVGGMFVSRELGFAQGFDFFYSPNATDVLGILPFREIVERATDWMARQHARPFFVFLHTYEVHLPYTPPPPYDRMFDAGYDGPYRERFTIDQYLQLASDDALSDRDLTHLRALYDGEIRSMDAAMGELLQFLERTGLAATTCVVVTSDHGDEFREHGNLFHHRAKLYEELVRIPLIVWCPARFRGGRVVEERVGLLDLMPTVLDMAGVLVPEDLDGHSFLGALTGDAAPDERPILSECDGSVEEQPGQVSAVQLSGQKLITSTVPGYAPELLFDLDDDPGERVDTADRRVDVAAHLRALVEAAAERGSREVAPRAAPPPTPNAAVRERMRALGYVLRGPGSAAPPLTPAARAE